jgi:hypothetical protein
MTRLEVLLEGASDVPTVREILTRRFGLREGEQFRLYPHRGKGSLPSDLLSHPPKHLRGLLDQLPAKLRGFSHLGDEACVVVVVDADKDRCDELLSRLNSMLERLHKRPRRVLFRIAIEETESWFIADRDAVAAAYPKAHVTRLKRVQPDAVVGASEKLAEALGMPETEVSGATKARWAERIAPHLDLEDPRSPSLRKFLQGIERSLGQSG